MSKPLRALFWKSLTEKSIEHFTLCKMHNEYVLDGVAFCNYGQPSKVHYNVKTNLAWETQRGTISMLIGKHASSLEFEVTPQRI
ncbi:MAG: putative glycolipid-binding domain-containing protein [Trueperaceae bacterium]